MNVKIERIWNYRFMLILALVVGILGIVLPLIMPDFELLFLMLTVVVLGGLLRGSSGFEQRGLQMFQENYKAVLEWLLLIIMGLYAFVRIAPLLPGTERTVGLLNAHWPGLLLAVMCVLMGITGLRRIDNIGSA